MQQRASPLIVVALLLSAHANAQEPGFLKIVTPQDKQEVSAGANCRVTGLVQLSDPKIDVEGLRVRMRAMSPRNGTFVIEYEGMVDLKKPTLAQPLFSFEANFKMPNKAGNYLLRIDCLNLLENHYPKSLMATSSIFVELK